MDSSLSFASRALALLSETEPRHYAQIARRLRKMPSRIEIGRETLWLASDGARIAVTAIPLKGRIVLQARITAADMLRLVDGTSTLEFLLREERLVILADAAGMLLLSEATAIFLDAALPKRNFAQLYERYRDWVSIAPGEQADQ